MKERSADAHRSITDREYLRIIAAWLNERAQNARDGGWSTQDVEPMRNMAADIHFRLDNGIGSAEAQVGP